MLWLQFLLPIMAMFRRQRARRILALFPNIQESGVCDLGGSLHFWEAITGIFQPKSLTILNISHDFSSLNSHGSGDKSKIVLYDGKQIPFRDQEIDILICNSVIEHVPVEERHNLVREIRRVSRSYVIQTPAYEFPLEPHFVAPFIHWLPRNLGRKLAHLSPSALLRHRPPEEINASFDSINLLDRRALQDLFPHEIIIPEKFMGLVKSYLVVYKERAEPVSVTQSPRRIQPLNAIWTLDWGMAILASWMFLPVSCMA